MYDDDNAADSDYGSSRKSKKSKSSAAKNSAAVSPPAATPTVSATTTPAATPVENTGNDYLRVTSNYYSAVLKFTSFDFSYAVC